MVPVHPAVGSAVMYEIHLYGTPPEELVAQFPSARLRRMPAQTLLMRRVSSQEELSVLLERVFSMGLVLNDVHELRVASPPSVGARSEGGQRSVYRAYEVRIDGELDAAMLRYLGWHHRHLPEQTALRLDSPPTDIHEFLNACCRRRLGIERVRRVTAAGSELARPARR